jgi:MFS superfamily sulfate permease-like transporter
LAFRSLTFLSLVIPQVPPLSALEANNGFFLESAVLVAVVGFIEHIVIAKLYAAKYNYQISPNRELVALGVSNFVGSFFHTFPTFGSLPRSALADSLGAKTELFSLVSAGVILISILFLGPIFSLLPRIVMSSIILVAAIGLFELHDIAFLFRIRAWRDLFLLALTFVLTVVLGIELGIGISLIISVFLIIRHTTFPFVSILGRVKDTQSYTEVSQVDAQLLPGILIVRIEEPLYFANIAQIKRLFVRIERLGDPKAHPGERTKDLPRVRAVIIHARNIISMDASAIQTVEEMVHDYHNRNVLVCWVKLRQILKERFIRVGLLDPLRMNEQVFEKVSDAVTYAEDYVAKYREEDAKLASASVVYDDDILQDEGLRQVNNHHV